MVSSGHTQSTKQLEGVLEDEFERSVWRAGMRDSGLWSVARCCPGNVPEPDGVQQLSHGEEELGLPSQWTVTIIKKN